MQTASILVESLGDKDLGAIQIVALKTWPIAYREILSKEQMEYMLDMFYSPYALKEQLANGHRFFGIHEEGELLGFASVQQFENETLKISKLYVLPQKQGRNFGRKLIDFIEDLARKEGYKKLTLNVNRFNKSRHFYEKLSFIIELEEDIEIGKGFLMEDYRMTKTLL